MAADPDSATISVKLILILEQNAELFRDAGGECYASLTIKGHRETHKLNSRDLKDWLARAFWLSEARAASGDKINEAFTVLRAKARYEGVVIETHLRVAEHDGVIYLDLCNDDWQQVAITQTGWQIVESADSPVRFRRADGMLALPVPVSGGSLDELRTFLNLRAEDSENWTLILAWLVAALRPCNITRFACPVLVTQDEQGSAKSTTSRLLRRLIDPNKADLRSAPKEERDLAISADHGRILAFDNLTHVSDALSNAMCRVATGGSFSARALYTDDGETIFDFQRPQMLNGIAEVVTKSDLLDRAILIYLPRIASSDRKLDRVIDREFEQRRPRILGALLDAVAAGLREMQRGVTLTELPRMADFAEWAVACEQGLGLQKGDFLRAYTSNTQRANGLAIEASPVAAVITAMIADCCQWEGTTGALHKILNGRLTTDGENPERKFGWPKSPRGLGDKLREIAPNLRRNGVEVAFGERGRGGYTISLRRLPERERDAEQTRAREHRNDVHNVHNVHAANEINELEREHVREHVRERSPANVRTDSGLEHVPLHVHTNVHSNVHSNVHTLKHYKQRGGEHRERCERRFDVLEGGVAAPVARSGQHLLFNYVDDDAEVI